MMVTSTAHVREVQHSEATSGVFSATGTWPWVANFHRFGGKNMEKCDSILCLGPAKYIKVTSHKCVIASPPARSMDCNFQGPCFLRFLRSQRPCHVEQQVMINQWIDIYIYKYNIVCSPHPSYGMGYDGVEPGQAYRHLRSKRHGYPELAG